MNVDDAKSTSSLSETRRSTANPPSNDEVRSTESAVSTDVPIQVTTTNFANNMKSTPTKQEHSHGMSLLQLVTPTTVLTSSASTSPASESTNTPSGSIASPASSTSSTASHNQAGGSFWRPRRIDKDELRSQRNRLSNHHHHLMQHREEMANDHNNVSRHRDESSSNVDDDDDDDDDEDDDIGGVIAIGITVPAEPVARGDKEDSASHQVARDLAKEEHRIKTLARATAIGSDMPGSTVTRRSMAVPDTVAHARDSKVEQASWKNAPALQDGPSLAAGSFKDADSILAASAGDASMMSSKQREKMERERAKAAMTASKVASGKDAKVPLASVALSQRLSSNMESRTNAEIGIKARARESAQAVGVARAQGAGPSLSNSRAQKEIQKMALAHCDGPSLASAMSEGIVSPPVAAFASAPSMSCPGAFASTSVPENEAIKQRSMDTGPSLAPADFSSMASMQMEAPVIEQLQSAEVHVGAYAIEGMDATHDQDLSDDEYSITDQNRPYVHDMENGYDDIFYVDPEAHAMESALDAELQVVVDGNVLTEEEDETLDPKAIRRLRMYQRGVFCLSCCAIALMTGAILGFAKDNGPPSLGWIQVDQTLYGSREEPQIFFGQSLDMTSDGKRLIVAAPGLDDEFTQAKVGEVRIFEQIAGLNGTEWQSVGKITGTDASTSVQMSIAASSDGTRIAVGQSHAGSGVANVYEEKDNEWTLSQNFSIPFEQGIGTWFGYAVALSADGNVLAVSAPMADTASGSKSGFVRVYQSTPNGWIPLGEDITGSSDNELLGWSLSVQVSARIRLILGAPSSNNEKGLVRVFDWTGSMWEQANSVLKGTSSLGRFGESVALSEDCRVLAVGAAGTSFVPGQVRVFRMESGVWVEDGHNFLGQDPADSYGMAVSLSNDGSVMVVGSGHANADSGRVDVYKYDSSNGDWINEGLSIEGGLGDDFGSTVAVSGDGLRVVGGAPSATFDGSVAQAGAVRVYDRDNGNEGEYGGLKSNTYSSK